jgi:thiamine kinase-like enzyme
MVLRFVEGRVFAEADVREPANLERVVGLLKRVHHDIPRHLRGPVLLFWVFHVIRDYGHTLIEGRSRHAPRLPGLIAAAEVMERAVGPVELVFGHNDLLAANLIDDGTRLWLVDWDYAGFGSPLFDLANLATNNQLPEDLDRRLLEIYFDAHVGDGRWRAYTAMKCASLLRETLWSMVSEIHSTLDFDYAGYTAENLARFERTYAAVAAELEMR